MRKLTVFSILVSIFILSSIVNAQQVEVIRFENNFVRGYGEPIVESYTFTSIADFATIRLWNGAADGIEKVSSSEIYINNELVFGPNNFNQNVKYLEAIIPLESNNTIDVTLKSKPRGTISIQIGQLVDAVKIIDSNGGTIFTETGIEVIIPANALSTSSSISVRSFPVDSLNIDAEMV